MVRFLDESFSQAGC